MENKESSAYVKARAVLLGGYFKTRGWNVAEGKNNTILFYIPSTQQCNYSQQDLADIIAESDFHVPETGLKMSYVTYMFFHHGRLYTQLEVLPTHEYDIYTV